MEVDPTIKDEMTKQVRIQHLESDIEIYRKSITQLEAVIADQKAHIDTLLDPQTIILYCLNCTHCRYSPQECVCMFRDRVKVYISPDDKICNNFNPKKTL